MSELLHDTHTWVLFATIIFVGLALVKGKAPLLNLLDARSKKIKADLDEAERLKNAAQELLADSQKKHRDALQTSQVIIDNAKATAERLAVDTEAKLTESLKRREAQLLERIARAETAAIEELKHQAADIAAKAAESLLHETLNTRGSKLVDSAIADIPAKMN